MVTARVLCTDLAGLRSQVFGLAEAAGYEVELRTLEFKSPWDKISAGLWVNPRWAVGAEAFAGPLPPVVIGAGGAGARVAAALRQPEVKAVAVQHPRMALRRFDLVMVSRHDGVEGENVIVTRTALHRVTPARLAAEKLRWAPVFAGQKRPLLAVLLGGSNGRYRFDPPLARELAGALREIILRGEAGVVMTPSRRTSPEVVRILREALEPLGAWIWDGSGDNPYFGMLACADVVLATADSVSMVSEAVATHVPVLLLRLPGKSERIGMFMDMLVADGRVRDFNGKLELWDCAPLDDTAAAGVQMRERLGV